MSVTPHSFRATAWQFAAAPDGSGGGARGRPEIDKDGSAPTPKTPGSSAAQGTTPLDTAASIDYFCDIGNETVVFPGESARSDASGYDDCRVTEWERDGMASIYEGDAFGVGDDGEAEREAAMRDPDDSMQGSRLYRDRLKRVLDVVLVLGTGLVSLPVIALLILAVWIEGGKPIFVQRRLGRNGRPFRMLKLRTMVPNAEAQLETYLQTNPSAAMEWSANQKLRSDPRVTAVGKFLRETSLDELPQLWNVLTGDMSLVGPRPMMLCQRALYLGEPYSTLRPGITGLWQTSERHSSRFDKRAEYDAAYAEQVSFFLDIRILLRTVVVVLLRRGC